MIRYRTEAFGGSEERNALQVMLFETYEMGNADIPRTLANGILAGTEIGRELDLLADRLQESGESHDEIKRLFQLALGKIEELTGKQVNFVLWLADEQDVRDKYWRYANGVYDPSASCPEPGDGDIDAYEIGFVILSDLGPDGALYGYQSFPTPIIECAMEQKSSPQMC